MWRQRPFRYLSYAELRETDFKFAKPISWRPTAQIGGEHALPRRDLLYVDESAEADGTQDLHE